MEKRFRDNAPVSAAEAATIILDDMKAKRRRILVGKDPEFLDDRVPAAPEEAYTPAFSDAFRKGSRCELSLTPARVTYGLPQPQSGLANPRTDGQSSRRSDPKPRK